MHAARTLLGEERVSFTPATHPISRSLSLHRNARISQNHRVAHIDTRVDHLLLRPHGPLSPSVRIVIEGDLIILLHKLD